VISDDVALLANHLWQSTLFAAVVWLITLALRENRAAVRHSLWVAASVKFLIPFSLLVGIGTQFQWLAPPSRASVLVEAIGQPFGASGASFAMIPIGATSSSASTNRVAAVLFCVWIFGFVVSILWWAIRWFQLRGAVLQATPMNLDLPIRALVHQGRLEPGVFGIFKPVLLFPDGIMDRLTPRQLQAVLAHELCHVRRRDNLTAAIHMFVEALFWFHPLVWWIKLRLVDEQERACDEEVLRLGGDPQVYAESILRICECYLTAPSMCVSGITSSNLKKRIGDIMKNRVALQLSLSKTLLLAVAAIAVLAGPLITGMGKVTIPSAPQRGLRGGAGPSSPIQGYRIGETRVVGAKLFNADTILSVLGLVSGEIYNESQLHNGFKELMKLYGSRGHVNFLPQPVIDLDEQRKVVNLTINIDEGPQYVVNRIGFIGNATTPDEVLRREILVKEGEVFDTSLWDLSISRLNQVGLFEEIRDFDTRVTFPPNESKVDVELRVKEKGR
jgi:beta-lactamase regulating signal transducer with metallopeptidase domain